MQTATAMLITASQCVDECFGAGCVRGALRRRRARVDRLLGSDVNFGVAAAVRSAFRIAVVVLALLMRLFGNAALRGHDRVSLHAVVVRGAER